MLNEQLRQDLLAMATEDSMVRERLAADGSLYEGYHPEMQQIHQQNSERLLKIIEKHGWPGSNLAGDDGAEAAWLIAHHAIGQPELQRKTLELIREAAQHGNAPLWQAAMLEDRIRMFEGRLQLYGTQFDWDENGEMSPYPEIEDKKSVNERRKDVGLRPLEEAITLQRASIKQSGEKPPANLNQRRKEMDEWARAAGWRK